ncbi:helix-turn-helix transcriptional regulator [Lachnospiraceae bacterium 47-T17]|jgi:DNA-binding Xre family transcriptional regulator|nr:helix-turn-helix transcriptional regulator [Lachnospiraceae bacterium]
MAVTYEKLWKLLQEKNMKKIEMQRKAGISGNILARMGRNEYISMESVEKICGVLHCCTDDILDFINEDSVESEDK